MRSAAEKFRCTDRSRSDWRVHMLVWDDRLLWVADTDWDLAKLMVEIDSNLDK